MDQQDQMSTMKHSKISNSYFVISELFIQKTKKQITFCDWILGKNSQKIAPHGAIHRLPLQSIFLTHWYNIKKTWKDNISKIALNNNKKYLMIKELE